MCNNEKITATRILIGDLLPQKYEKVIILRFRTVFRHFDFSFVKKCWYYYLTNFHQESTGALQNL